VWRYVTAENQEKLTKALTDAIERKAHLAKVREQMMKYAQK
jgi:hypothetical protein